MKAKTFEIVDDGTLIPALAVQLDPGNDADRFLIARSGYGGNPRGAWPFVMLWPMSSGHGLATSDPHGHNGDQRTWPTAHEYIEKHFDALESGSVVDVEHLRNETTEPKLSARFMGRES